jgi:phage-related protein
MAFGGHCHNIVTTVRVFYAAAKTGTIVVFHAFQKKSQKTPVRQIDLARRRLREVLDAKIEF